MDFINLLIIASLASIIPGEIGRINVHSLYGGITLLELFTSISLAVSFFYLIIKKKKLFMPKNGFFTSFLVFVIVAAASSVLSFRFFPASTVFSGFLFLLRFVVFTMFSILIFNSIKKSSVNNFLNLFLVIGFMFTLIGILQFFLFSDLTFLTKYGWDPHQSRVVSTLLDPNYTGYLLVCFSLFSLSGYFFTGKIRYIALFMFFSISLVLTFSRSSYIAFLIGILTVGILKSPKLIIYASLASLLVFLSVPKARQRIIGALAVDETSQARIVSWQKAIVIIKSSPVLGVGFNNYRFAQQRLGLLDSEEGLAIHSSGGTDSSLLFVAATTGIVGLTSYIFLLAWIFLNLLKNARQSAIKLASSASFIALLFHSQFVNSLFFPPIMLAYFFLIGLSFVHDS